MITVKEGIPRQVAEVGFDFPFCFEKDPPKVWRFEIPPIQVAISELTWHLYIPFWTHDSRTYFSPIELMANPDISPSHYRRVVEADMCYPIDVTCYKGRTKIVDGLHRLTKAVCIERRSEVAARHIPIEKLMAL